MEVLLRTAPKSHEVGLDQSRTSSWTLGAIRGSDPILAGAIRRANGNRIHAVGRNLDAIIPKGRVHGAIVANGNCHEGAAITKQFINDGCPRMNLGILNRNLRADTEVEKLILPGEEHLLDVPQGSIEFERVLIARFVIENP
ncbi:hypothetical protein D9M68_595990 [compost metagenome]